MLMLTSLLPPVVVMDAPVFCVMPLSAISVSVASVVPIFVNAKALAIVMLPAPVLLVLAGLVVLIVTLVPLLMAP